MDIKKILAGEKMPDKNDPRYKEQYEREVEAGRKFANKTKLTLLVMKIQSWANVHRVGFLVIVFGFVISLFAAYEKATGKKYELTNPYDVSAFKKDPSSEMVTEEKKATSDAESKSNKKENPEK